MLRNHGRFSIGCDLPNHLLDQRVEFCRGCIALLCNFCSHAEQSPEFRLQVIVSLACHSGAIPAASVSLSSPD